MSVSRRRFTPEDIAKSHSLSRTKKPSILSQLDLEDAEVPFRDADPDSDETPLSDLDQFNIPARDEKGISEAFHLSVPPLMLRHIDLILRSQRFPYLRRSDFVRHAIYRHIRWCVSLRKSIQRHMLIALEAIMEDCRDSEQRVRVEAVLQKIEERIGFHLDQGDPGEAMRLMGIMRARLEGVSGDYWSRSVKDTLDRKFFEPLMGAGVVTETEQ